MYMYHNLYTLSALTPNRNLKMFYILTFSTFIYSFQSLRIQKHKACHVTTLKLFNFKLYSNLL